MQFDKKLYLYLFSYIWVQWDWNMQYPMAFYGVGGWVYFELDLAVLTVDELHLTPKLNWAEIWLASSFADIL